MVVMTFCDMPQKLQKQLTNISLKQFVALSGEFQCLPLLLNLRPGEILKSHNITSDIKEVCSGLVIMVQRIKGGLQIMVLLKQAAQCLSYLSTHQRRYRTIAFLSDVIHL